MSFPNCPTCGDTLHQTECPRCDWGGWNTFDDATKNPQDPTVDLHRGIQSAWEDEPSWNRAHLPWEPGVEGKGWLGENGVYSWRIDPKRYPRHMDRRQAAEQTVGRLLQPFHIGPDGYVYDVGRSPIPPEHMEAIKAHDPRLNDAQEDFTLGSIRWWF